MNMLRYTRNKFRKESISAKLIEKKEGEYQCHFLT